MCPQKDSMAKLGAENSPGSYSLTIRAKALLRRSGCRRWLSLSLVCLLLHVEPFAVPGQLRDGHSGDQRHPARVVALNVHDEDVALNVDKFIILRTFFRNMVWGQE